MTGDDPPFLCVGTEVSAKYRGAFCEAKVKKAIKSIKCKVFIKDSQSSLTVTDEAVKGILRAGTTVEVKDPESGQYVEGVISKLSDCSTYTVVFDDGDERTLRRTKLCLKGEKHFIESETLDNLPLSHPEHFGTPVMQSKKGKRQRCSLSGGFDDSSESDSDSESPKRLTYRGRFQELVGKIMVLESGDKKKSISVPVLVVLPDAQSSDLKPKDHILVKSFKDSKFNTVARKELKEFTREVAIKNEDKTLKTAMEKALYFFDSHELPATWDKEDLLGSDGDDDFGDDESSDDEQSEEKDRFVAQLYKFMDDRGTPINKGPAIANKDLNLYRLFKVVQNIGGYNRVTSQMKWSLVYSKMGLPTSGTASAQIKNAYKKYLHAFEDFYRKLGSTMGTISRPGRNRHNSGRSIIAFRDREKELIKSPKSPSVKAKDEDKSKTPKSSTDPSELITKARQLDFESESEADSTASEIRVTPRREKLDRSAKKEDTKATIKKDEPTKPQVKKEEILKPDTPKVEKDEESKKKGKKEKDKSDEVKDEPVKDITPVNKDMKKDDDDAEMKKRGRKKSARIEELKKDLEEKYEESGKKDDKKVNKEEPKKELKREVKKDEKDIKKDEKVEIKKDEKKDMKNDEKKEVKKDEKKEVKKEEKKDIKRDVKKNLKTGDKKEMQKQDKKETNTDEKGPAKKDEKKEMKKDEKKVTKKEVKKDAKKEEKKELKKDEKMETRKEDETISIAKKDVKKDEGKKEIKKADMKKDSKKDEVKKDAKKDEVKKDLKKAEVKKDNKKEEVKKDEVKKEVKKVDVKKETKITEPKKEPKKETKKDLKKEETSKDENETSKLEKVTKVEEKKELKKEENKELKDEKKDLKKDDKESKKEDKKEVKKETKIEEKKDSKKDEKKEEKKPDKKDMKKVKGSDEDQDDHSDRSEISSGPSDGASEDSSKRDESEESSSTSKSETTRTKHEEYPLGTKLKIKYGRGRNQKIYEAKVTDTGMEGSQKQYRVHYAGWNPRYDEWIKAERIFSVVYVPDKNKLQKRKLSPTLSKQLLPWKKKAKLASTQLSDGRVKKLISPGNGEQPRRTRSNSVEVPIVEKLPLKQRKTRSSIGITEAQSQDNGESSASDNEHSEVASNIEIESTVTESDRGDMRYDSDRETWDEPETEESINHDQFDESVDSLSKTEEADFLSDKTIPDKSVEVEESATIENEIVSKEQIQECTIEKESISLPQTLEQLETTRESLVDNTSKNIIDVFKWEDEDSNLESFKSMCTSSKLLHNVDVKTETVVTSKIIEVKSKLASPIKNLESVSKDAMIKDESHDEVVVEKERLQPNDEQTLPKKPLVDEKDQPVDNSLAVSGLMKLDTAEEKFIPKEAPDSEISEPAKLSLFPEASPVNTVKPDLGISALFQQETKSDHEDDPFPTLTILDDKLEIVKEKRGRKKKKETKKCRKISLEGGSISSDNKDHVLKIDSVINAVIENKCDNQTENFIETETEKKKVKKKVKKKDSSNSGEADGSPEKLDVTKSTKHRNSARKDFRKSSESGTCAVPKMFKSKAKRQLKSQTRSEAPECGRRNKRLGKKMTTSHRVCPDDSKYDFDSSLNSSANDNGSNSDNANVSNTVFENTPPTTPENMSELLDSHGSIQPSSSRQRDEYDFPSSENSQASENELPFGGGYSAMFGGEVRRTNVIKLDITETSVHTSKRKSDSDHSHTTKRRKRLLSAKSKAEKSKHHVATDSDSSNSKEGSKSPELFSSTTTGSDIGSDSLVIAKAERTPRFNLNLDEGKQLEGEDRINFLMSKIQEIRRTYMQLKSEVASIDRRRKRARRKDRESSQTSSVEVDVS